MNNKIVFVTSKALHSQARQFKGTLEDAEEIKAWANEIDISWSPMDDNYTGAPGEEPDMSKGVYLDVASHLGFQSADSGDWLVKDSIGLSVYTEPHFKHYFTEFKEHEA